jgi:hypothetical protein
MPKPRRVTARTAAKRRSRRTAPRKNGAGGPRALHYKIVELSHVDEIALERTLNEWVPKGWTFDGVQFAMRESSKRPSMAFVFFTREGEPLPAAAPEPSADAFRPPHEAQAHLRRLAGEPSRQAPRADPWARLRALAGEEEHGESPDLSAIDPDEEDE